MCPCYKNLPLFFYTSSRNKMIFTKETMVEFCEEQITLKIIQ